MDQLGWIGAARHHDSVIDGCNGYQRGGMPSPTWLRGSCGLYLLASLFLLAIYPVLSPAARKYDYLVVSLGVVPAVVVGLRRISPSQRLPWWLLLIAVIIFDFGIFALLFEGDLARMSYELFDTVGNALTLAAAVALVVRQRRNDLGSIIDTTIVGLAVGGLLWGLVLAPNLVSGFGAGMAQVNLFVAVFALSGVLGALGRLLQVSGRLVSALWWLVAALVFSLAGYILLAVSSDPRAPVGANIGFMAGYAAIGLFGLDPKAVQVAQSGSVSRDDALSVGRLAFLGVAVAAIPIVMGVRALGTPRPGIDGVLLAISAATIAALVMVRIGRLSADRDRAEKALRHEATHDPLTGLPNRRAFVAELSDRLLLGQGCAILFCDLDGFKAVNDRLGHDAGDRLLVEVARRLRACVRDNDVVSRFGGDEFLILFLDTRLVEVDLICERIIAAISAPVRLRDELVTIGASIGLAVSGEEADSEELIRRADHAMYKAKRDEPAAPGIRIVFA